MAFIDRANYAQGEDFQKRVRQALVKACSDVMAESGSTDNHENRVTWANEVINDPMLVVDSVAYAVAETWEIAPLIDAGTDPTDTQISGAVSALFNAFAGVL